MSEWRDEMDEELLLVHKDIIPPGPAYAYDEDRKEVVGVTVSGYLAENIWLDGEFAQKLLGYRCNLLHHAGCLLMGNWPPHDVFATREEAEAKTAFTPVDLPPEVYRLALGVDDNGERINEDDAPEGVSDWATIEDCELPSCCGDLSEARDLLITCMMRKGLERWRIDLHGQELA